MFDVIFFTTQLTLLQKPAKLREAPTFFRQRSLEIVLDREDGDLIISVKDDGPGIPPEHHAAVFERYKQLPLHDDFERKGHGLGLAGALILARRLGGDISLESVPGQGATFRFRIPVTREKPDGVD